MIKGALIFIVILTISLCLTIILLKKTDNYRALKRLKGISQPELQVYFDSYGKIFNDQNMVSDLNDFINNIPAATFEINDNSKPSEYTADCYNILNDLCALGNVKKMYIPRCLDMTKNLKQNQTLYERQVGDNLNVRPGGKLLEIGSGCGRIAYDMSKYTGCDVYGINIDETQIRDSQKYSKSKKWNKTHFIFSDLNDRLPFDDNTFDGIYEFGAMTSFITNYKSVFSELYRVLKPGGILFISDAVLLDNFNKGNPRHMELLRKARMVMAGGVFLHYAYFETFGKDAGFKLLSSRGGDYPNLAQDLPMLEKEHKHFAKIEKIVSVCSKLKLLPKHMPYLLERLRYGGDDLVELEKGNCLTMDWDFYFQK